MILILQLIKNGKGSALTRGSILPYSIAPYSPLPYLAATPSGGGGGGGNRILTEASEPITTETPDYLVQE